jgi:monoterpene epsilon-lactone hydrolase
VNWIFGHLRIDWNKTGVFVSIRLKVLTIISRLFVKPVLQRSQNPSALRQMFEDSSAWFCAPHGFWSGSASYTVDGAVIKGRWAGAGVTGSDRVVLFLHGGGFVAGSSTSYAKLAARIGAALNAQAFVPDYRLAPEHPFPAACEDALTIYQALLAKGYDPDQIAVVGDSAGGNLALGLMAQILKLGLPKPAVVALMSPAADLTYSGASFDYNASRDPVLPTSQADLLNQIYLEDADPAQPLASPLFADLAGCPPILLQASSTEILLSDAERIEEKLRTTGVETELQVFSNCPHVWQLLAGYLPEADGAIAQIATFCNRYLMR